LFPPGEHGIYCYYGRIGQGKTYAMTADIIQALRHGKVVYSNYPLDWSGFDERFSWPHVFVSLFGLKRDFYEFYKDNLKHIEIDEHFHDTLSNLTDCIVALDEGYVAFDSYEMAKMSMAKRVAVLHTRHFDRSINIISQRPTAIHRMLRANVNRFYKYEKLFSSPFMLFRRLEYQDMIEENVDEENPISVKLYIGRKKIYEAYNSKYLRGDMKDSQKVQFEAYDLNYVQKLLAVCKLLWRKLRPGPRPGAM